MERQQYRPLEALAPVKGVNTDTDNLLLAVVAHRASSLVDRA